MSTSKVHHPIVSQQVLARWTDGLFYLATVQELDKNSAKCLLRFEDKTEFWVLLKDLQQGRESCKKWQNGINIKNGQKTCRVCHSSESKSYKKLLKCVQCKTAIHQHCHDPVIYQIRLLSSDWKCSSCESQPELKPRNGLRERMTEGMRTHAKLSVNETNNKKHTLPYNLHLLTWDAHHKTNLQQKYCYCGKPGDWYMKMIQCFRCKMWYHEACVQYMKKPMLFGDRFYLFICSVCTGKEEFIQRLDMTWVDITQLALFNLTVEHRKKYYAIGKTIAPWIYSQWHNLQVSSQLCKSSVEEVEKAVHDVLVNNPKKFQYTTETSSGVGLWGLRVRVPPPPPNLVWKLQYRSKQLPLKNSPKLPRRSVLSKNQDLKPGKRKRVSSPLAGNGTTKTKRLALLSSSYDGESCSSLDTIIPCLPHYDAHNHPFKTELECSTEVENKRRKAQLLDLFTQDHYLDNLSASSTTCMMSDTDSPTYSEGTPLNDHNALLQPVQRIRSKPKRKTQKDICLLDAASHLASERGVDLNMCSNTTTSGLHSRQDVLEKSTLDGISGRGVSITDLRTTVGNYFGAAERLDSGEQFHVQGRRITEDGRVQYLIQWQTNNHTINIT